MIPPCTRVKLLLVAHLCCTRLRRLPLLLLLGQLRLLLLRLLLRLLLLGLLTRLLLLHCLLAAGLGHIVGKLVDTDCIVVLAIVATKGNQHVVLRRVPAHTPQPHKLSCATPGDTSDNMLAQHAVCSCCDAA